MARTTAAKKAQVLRDELYEGIDWFDDDLSLVAPSSPASIKTGVRWPENSDNDFDLASYYMPVKNVSHKQKRAYTKSRISVENKSDKKMPGTSLTRDGTKNIWARMVSPLRITNGRSKLAQGNAIDQ